MFGINFRVCDSVIEYCAAALSDVRIPALQRKFFSTQQQAHPVGAGCSIFNPAIM